MAAKKPKSKLKSKLKSKTKKAKRKRKRKMPLSATNTTHDSRGKFKAGNPGGPGNPYLREYAKGRDALLVARRSFNPDQVVAVLTAMFVKGCNGNVAAARVFLEYLCGKPKQVIDAVVRDEGIGSLRDDPQKLIAIIEAGRHAAEDGKGSGGADTD